MAGPTSGGVACLRLRRHVPMSACTKAWGDHLAHAHKDMSMAPSATHGFTADVGPGDKPQPALRWPFTHGHGERRGPGPSRGPRRDRPGPAAPLTAAARRDRLGGPPGGD